jgi:regulator of protease activity HflC (stomatin/prohibitin superfamily)
MNRGGDALAIANEVTIDRPNPLLTERATEGFAGIPALGVSLALILAGTGLLVWGPGLASQGEGLMSTLIIALGILLLLLGLVATGGLTPVSPGEARVISLFGGYSGTVRRSGLRWVNPLAKRRKVSTRIRNHETALAKVNDADGNPIEIAAVVVWQVQDTARALYEVDDFVAFVGFQTETAVRLIATTHPYDTHGDGPPSLRDNAEVITTELSAEIAARVAPAGVKVIESRITRLAYAPEIAQAMLRRQQAGAVVAARKRIVEGAVGMVQLALERLEEQDIVELDDERKAAMVSNLLVVLCSEQGTQPVINTGSLYH